MDRRIIPALLLLGAGCKTTPKEVAPPAPKEVRITNREYLDVGSCQVKQLTPTISTEDTVVGAQLAARPLIEECLVDPKSRGPEKETVVKVTTTVTEEGAKHEVAGTNLTPEGIKCAETAMERALKLPPLEKGAKPAKAELQVPHVVGNNPAVTMGVNEPSDIMGTIRLTGPSWCDCYAGFTDTAPPAMRAWVHIPKGESTITHVTFTQPRAEKPQPAAAPAAPEAEKPAAGAEAAAPPPPPETTYAADFTPEQRKLAECLDGKLKALKFQTPASYAWELPYEFEFFHSGALNPASNVSSTLAFMQLQSVYGTRQGEAVMAYGVWADAGRRFNALLPRYNKRDKKVVKQLKDLCAARGKMVDSWVSRIDGQLEVERRMADLTQKESASDQSWAEEAAKRAAKVKKTEQERADAVALRNTERTQCKDL